jgi:hypothetical protein
MNMNNTQQTNRNTVRELTPAIGESVYVQFESLAILATVVDAKNSWGKVRLLIRPAMGVGEQWIELSRLVANPNQACHEAFVARTREQV